MKVDNLSNTWTKEERLAWRQFYTPLLASISLSLCIVALVLFHIYPRLRTFPRSLLCWLNYYNIYYCVYVILKWSPAFPWHAAWASNIVPGSAPCRIALFIDVSHLTGQTVCNTLVCFTLFLIIVLRVDIENNNRYYWCYLAFATLYPFGIGIPAGFGFSTHWSAGSSCNIQNYAGNFATRFPYVILFAIQIGLLSATLFKIKQVVASVKGNASPSFPLTYLFIRFIATFLAQTYNLLPIQLSLIFIEHVDSSAIFMRLAYASHASGPIPDALVMILGNVDFMAWATSKYRQLKSKLGIGVIHINVSDSVIFSASTEISANSRVEGTFSEQVVLGENVVNSVIEMDNLQLSTSAQKMGSYTPNRLSLV